MDQEVLRAIEFVDERERLLFAEAQLGEEAIAFIQSEMGRYLHGRAKNQYEDNAHQLVGIDLGTPEGQAQARQCQLKAEIANSFMRWIADLVSNGENAYQQLKENSNEQ